MIVVVTLPENISNEPRNLLLLADNDTIEDIFNQWKQQYGITYPTIQEDKARFDIFKNNYLWINRHNSLEKRSYKVALNKYAGLTLREFKALYSASQIKQSTTTTTTTLKPEPLPQTSVDWRQKGVVTQVKNQGAVCASDWAFAAAAALESAYAINGNPLTNVSTQQLIACSTEFGTNGCNGGSVEQAFEYVRLNGIQSEKSYPSSSPMENVCQYQKEKAIMTIVNFTPVAQGDPLALQNAVTRQPVAAVMEADSSAFQFYAGGTFDLRHCGTTLDHSVLIVGYGSDNEGNEYWIVKNSFGTDWGMEGYILMHKDSTPGKGQCGINMAASYPNLA
jgi:C1A family cysteine protease